MNLDKLTIRQGPTVLAAGTVIGLSLFLLLFFPALFVFSLSLSVQSLACLCFFRSSFSSSLCVLSLSLFVSLYSHWPVFVSFGLYFPALCVLSLSVQSLAYLFSSALCFSALLCTLFLCTVIGLFLFFPLFVFQLSLCALFSISLCTVNRLSLFLPLFVF